MKRMIEIGSPQQVPRELEDPRNYRNIPRQLCSFLCVVKALI